MRIDEKLAYLRKQKGLSQIQLAEELQVSRQAISRWEVGAAAPSTDNLKFLSALYDVPVDALLNDSIELPGREECGSNEQEPVKKEKTKRMSKQAIAAACFLLVAAILLICILTRPKQNTGVTPISEMEVEEDDQSSTVGDFSIGW